jgi:hypothetical protein
MARTGETAPVTAIKAENFIVNKRYVQYLVGEKNDVDPVDAGISKSKAEHHPVLYILSAAHFSHQEHSSVLGYPVPLHESLTSTQKQKETKNQIRNIKAQLLPRSSAQPVSHIHCGDWRWVIERLSLITV